MAEFHEIWHVDPAAIQHRAHSRRIVMIARYAIDWRRQTFQTRAQQAIGFSRTVMGEVAGGQPGLRRFGCGRRQHPLQRLQGVDTVQRGFRIGPEVGIGDLQEANRR